MNSVMRPKCPEDALEDLRSEWRRHLPLAVIARATELHHKTLQKAARSGRLEAVRVGRRWRCTPEAALALLRANARSSA